MARIEKEYLADKGRDTGKLFLLKEFPAMQAEKLGRRALMAIGKSGVTFEPDELQSGLQGIAALASTGLRALAGVDAAELDPLMDEMLTCVEFVPSAADRSVRLGYPLFMDQIEEVATIVALRDEVVNLHMGFSPLAILSNWGALARQALSNTSDIPTSPPLPE